MRKWDKRRWLGKNSRDAAIAVIALIAAGIGLIRLTLYGISWLSARRTEGELRQIYTEAAAQTESVPDAAGLSAESLLPEGAEDFSAPSRTEDAEKDAGAAQGLGDGAAGPVADPSGETAAEPADGASADPGAEEPDGLKPAAAPLPTLEPVNYPGNPKRKVSQAFRELRQKNSDIVGWLQIKGLLEDAVVQRDNTYYMTRDPLKKKNSNGSLFLDAGVSLKSRPYTLLIYGHNMKSGAMFGCLRQFERLSFYRRNAFITFNTMYEEGRYVIFAVGTVSTETGAENNPDYFDLMSLRPENRMRAIGTLKEASVYACDVDVQAEDQLLLLVTCVDKETDRRVVAARRVREGEKENELQKLIDRTVTR